MRPPCDQGRAQSGQVPFSGVGKTPVQLPGDAQFKHSIAKEFLALVVRGAKAEFIGIGGVRQCPFEQSPVLEVVVQGLFQAEHIRIRDMWRGLHAEHHILFVSKSKRERAIFSCLPAGLLHTA